MGRLNPNVSILRKAYALCYPNARVYVVLYLDDTLRECLTDIVWEDGNTMFANKTFSRHSDFYT
jgi:hypothetical protein